MITDRIRLPDTFRKSVNGETKSTIVSLVPGQNTYTVAGQVPPSAAAGGGAVGGGAVGGGSYPSPERYTGRNGKLDPSELVSIGNGQLLEKNAAAAFLAMSRAAKQDLGVNLVPTSGYRSYDKQKSLWDNRAKNPYPVAPPGTSDHGLGLAVDIGVGANGEVVQQWLVQNHKRFGFSHPLPVRDRIHWVYVGTGG